MTGLTIIPENMKVCLCVFAITATPLNLELSNFGITFVMSISKNNFLKFLKNCLCRVIALYLGHISDLSVNLNSSCAITKTDRNTKEIA